MKGQGGGGVAGRLTGVLAIARDFHTLPGMELRHLRYFHAVAEALNFSRAAERVRVAQPALSRQIRDLEEELGVQLFRRSTAQVQLTDAGRSFLEDTRNLLSNLEQAVVRAQRVGAGITGELNIGSDWNLPAPIASSARQLTQRHPDLTVNFVELPSHEHIAAVLEQRIHVGFVASRQIGTRENLSFLHILSSPLVVLLPPDHPCSEETVPLRTFREERWVALDESRYPGFRALLSQIMRPAQFVPRFGRSTGSLQGLVALVTAGEGVALLPEVFLPPERSGFRVVQTDAATYELYAVWHASNQNTFVAEYVEALRAEMRAGSPAVMPDPRRVRGS